MPPNVVFSDTNVQEEEWYRETVKRTVHVFTNESTDEFCIARKLSTPTTLVLMDSNGTAVMVVSVAKTSWKTYFPVFLWTAGSGYAILDDDGKTCTAAAQVSAATFMNMPGRPPAAGTG